MDQEIKRMLLQQLQNKKRHRRVSGKEIQEQKCKRYHSGRFLQEGDVVLYAYLWEDAKISKQIWIADTEIEHYALNYHFISKGTTIPIITPN